MGRSMLHEYGVAEFFWIEVVSTACYIINHVHLHLMAKKTCYKMYKGRKSSLSYLHVFGFPCFILKSEMDQVGKFDSKDDEGIFLRYSTFSKAFIIYNKRIMKVEESINVRCDETNNSVKKVTL